MLATAEASGDRFAEGTALHGLGLTYQRLGRSEEASAVLDRALRARTEADDVLGQAATLYLSGYVVGYRGEHETALVKLRRSLELYQRHGGDRYGEGVVLNSIGAELYQLRRQDQALTYLKSALAIMREIGHAGMEAHVSGTIGSILLSQMRYAQARAYMLRALATAETLGQPALDCFVLRQAGWALTRAGDLGRRARVPDAVGGDGTPVQHPRSAGDVAVPARRVVHRAAASWPTPASCCPSRSNWPASSSSGTRRRRSWQRTATCGSGSATRMARPRRSGSWS